MEIDSKEYGFSYTFGELGGGMQCNFDGGTDEYQELFHYLRKIEDLIRMVDRYDEAIRKTWKSRIALKSEF